MRIQACIHVGLGIQNIQERWSRDPWFFQAVEACLGDMFGHAAPMESTAPGSWEAGARWFDFGELGWLGLIPVSDGTDLVLQVREGGFESLRERLSKRHRRRMGDFLRAVERHLGAV